MAVLAPISSPIKPRNFGVLDLEWVPAERMPLPLNATVVFDGMRSTCRIPLPVSQRQSDPLQVRIASFYDQPITVEGQDGDEPEREERFLCFTTTRELIDFLLTSENRGRWFYAHAGGLADMEFVLDDLFTEIKDQLVNKRNVYTVTIADEVAKASGISKHEDYVKGTWKVRASFSGSSAIIIHVSKGKNAWHFIDSYWLFRDKLATIGKAIGIKKGDTPEAVEFINKKYGKASLDDLDDKEIESFYRDAPIEVLTSYNRVDCEILWKAIAMFEKEINELGGQLQQTIASTGMNLIRRSYLKTTIYTSDKVNQIAEQSYFASRVEVTARNLEDFQVFDINSSFPYSMTFPQPGGLIEVRTTLPDEASDNCIFLADVTIEVPDMALPPVPYRVEGRVFFPIGRWRSWLTSTDIHLALREGCILHKVHEVYVFEPFNDIADFVREIYGRRAATSDPFRKLLYKYLLNCVHGDTLVTLANGNRAPISKLVGSKNVEVMAFDEGLGRFSPGNMLRCWESKVVDKMLLIRFDDGSLLKMTPEQEVMEIGGKWRKASDLKRGDFLWAVSRKKISLIEWVDGGPVYDMEVEALHTYVAGGVVVHNCPYGKFAESPWKQEMLINPSEIDRDKLQLLQPGVWLAEKKAIIAHRHVPISTHITALSRRLLYDYAKECYRQGCVPAYMDTDSISTKAVLPTDETKLGSLKLEKKMSWGEFLAPKIYRGEGFELQKDGQWKPTQVTKAKGFSLGKSRGEAWRRFDSIAGGDRIGIQRQARMRELYRSGSTSPVDLLVIKCLVFEMLSKRFHYPDGETRPWSMTELMSGDVYPKGFDFHGEILDKIDTTTRAMMAAVV